MCRKNGLSAKGQKHHLVERIAASKNEGPPDHQDGLTYNGDFKSVPKSISLLRKLPTAKLRFILKNTPDLQRRKVFPTSSTAFESGEHSH